MSLKRDVRHGLRIGRAEFVRSARGYVRDRRHLLGLGLVILFFGGNLLFSLPTAYVLGRSARTVTAIPYFAPVSTVLPVALLLLAMARTLERIGSVEAEQLVLMTVHPRAVVIGLISAEVGRLALWFGVPLGAFATAFAVGLGTPSLLVTVGLVALPMVCWAAIWGYALGIGLLRLFRHLPSVRRLLKIGGSIAMIGLIVASQFIGRYLAAGDFSLDRIRSTLTVEPVADFVGLAFVGTPLGRSPSIAALVILIGVLALIPVGLAVATRQASILWFTEAPSRERTRRVPTSTGGFAPKPPFVWTKAGRVAWGQLVRAIRHPQELSHLVMVLFFIAPVGTAVGQLSGDALGPLIAGAGVGFGTYLAGAAFGLNPLGDDRPQLPLLLLSGTTPRAFVRGRSLAGLAIGVPVAVLVPVLSLFAGTTPFHAVVFGAVGVVLCLAAALFAVGLGAVYPIYEEREFWGSETVVPSTIVMMVYMFVVGGGTVIGLVATWFAVTGNLVITPVFVVGFGSYLLVTVGASVGSYRYAIRRYRRYMFD